MCSGTLKLNKLFSNSLRICMSCFTKLRCYFGIFWQVFNKCIVNGANKKLKTDIEALDNKNRSVFREILANVYFPIQFANIVPN